MQHKIELVSVMLNLTTINERNQGHRFKFNEIMPSPMLKGNSAILLRSPLT